MKKIFSTLILVSTLLCAAAQKDIINDPDVEMRSINGNFTAIKVSGGIDLFLTQNDKEAVAISANNSKIKEGIKTVVENGILRIYYNGDNKGLGNWKNRKMRAYVSFKSLEKLIASGACDVQVSGAITGNSLEMEMSGASDFKGMVKLNSLKIELSGASDIKIAGSATTVTINSSGASDVNGYDLVTEICTAKASGASDINITVNKELNAHASGASDIYFKGQGIIKESHTGGSSTVAKKS